MVVSFDHLFQLNKIHSVTFQTVYEKLKIVIILPGTVQVSLFHISAEELSAQRIINDNYAKNKIKLLQHEKYQSTSPLSRLKTLRIDINLLRAEIHRVIFVSNLKTPWSYFQINVPLMSDIILSPEGDEVNVK